MLNQIRDFRDIFAAIRLKTQIYEWDDVKRMLTYDSLIVEFYSPPTLVGGGKPFVTTPDQSVKHRVKIVTDIPESAYAFRVIPIVSHTKNRGIADEETFYASLTDTPLCFLGGVHMDADAMTQNVGARSKKARALKSFGTEFVLTKGDVLVPFDPIQDVILELTAGEWEQVYPIPAPESAFEPE